MRLRSNFRHAACPPLAAGHLSLLVGVEAKMKLRILEFTGISCQSRPQLLQHLFLGILMLT